MIFFLSNTFLLVSSSIFLLLSSSCSLFLVLFAFLALTRMRGRWEWERWLLCKVWRWCHLGWQVGQKEGKSRQLNSDCCVFWAGDRPVELLDYPSLHNSVTLNCFWHRILATKFLIDASRIVNMIVNICNDRVITTNNFQYKHLDFDLFNFPQAEKISNR